MYPPLSLCPGIPAFPADSGLCFALPIFIFFSLIKYSRHNPQNYKKYNIPAGKHMHILSFFTLWRKRILLIRNQTCPLMQQCSQSADIVPRISALIFSVKPDNSTAAGTLLIIWLAKIDAASSCPPTCVLKKALKPSIFLMLPTRIKKCHKCYQQHIIRLCEQLSVQYKKDTDNNSQ